MNSSNTDVIGIPNFMFVVNIVIGIGSNSAVSASKITAIRKNLDENRSHTEFFGTHPHSYGNLFFGLHYFSMRLQLLRLFRLLIVVATVVTIIIIYLVFTDFLIGSQVYSSCIRYVLFYLPHQ